jgi:glycosyltransferase involved in cell wall biosynthesis
VTLDADREFAVFRRFDAVIAIQSSDYDKMRGVLGDDRVVLTPHPALAARKALRPSVASIGFVASGWKANIDGIGWFAAEVWPAVRRPGLTLDLYGWIGEHWPVPPGRGIVARGFVPDLETAYGAIDIVINPVRYGAGLKIKTVEALGRGLPLVTTREGARGLDAIAGRAFLVADDAAAFAAALDRLIGDEAARRALGEAAYRFAEAELSPEACYAALVREINRPKETVARG